MNMNHPLVFLPGEASAQILSKSTQSFARKEGRILCQYSILHCQDVRRSSTFRAESLSDITVCWSQFFDGLHVQNLDVGKNIHLAKNQRQLLLFQTSFSSFRACFGQLKCKQSAKGMHLELTSLEKIIKRTE